MTEDWWRVTGKLFSRETIGEYVYSSGPCRYGFRGGSKIAVDFSLIRHVITHSSVIGRSRGLRRRRW